MSGPLPAAREAAIRASFASQGLMRRLGAVLEEVGAGRCVVSLPFADDVAQQHGFFHGGAVGALADVAGGYAAMGAMAEGEHGAADVVSLEYKVNCKRGVKALLDRGG